VVADLRHEVHLLGPLSLELTYNRGVAFSLGGGDGLPIDIGVLIVLLAVLLRVVHHLSPVRALSVGFIGGGALSNLGDRIFRHNGGAVVDFLHTSFWPTFNIADASVVVGCAMVVVISWRSGAHHTMPEAPEKLEGGSPVD
jgi:signal peptidase II